MTHRNPDNEFCSRIAEGDQSAFADLYNESYESILGFVLRYVMSPTLAQDLTQDVFVKVWEKRSSFSNVQNLQAYLYRIARNHTLDFLKRNSLSNEILTEIRHHYKTAAQVVEDEIQEKEYFEFLHGVLQRLPERSQDIFRMCRSEKRSYQEVAGLLGISRDTVKHHMVQSMRVIRESVMNRFDVLGSVCIFVSFLSTLL